MPHSELKLGKQPFKENPKDLMLKNVEVNLPLMPTKPFGEGMMFTDWQMLGNGPDDTVQPGFQGAGDCVEAGAAHETRMWNHLAKHDVMFTGANVISDYSAATGYVIGQDSTDQGTEVRAYMDYRRNTGIIDESGKRHKVDAYVSIDAKDWDTLIRCIWTFGVVGMGFEFPDSAWQQFDNGQVWDVVAGATIDGGHYVPCIGSPDPQNEVTVITWAKRQVMTKAFYEKYNDEAWVPLTKESLLPASNVRHIDWDTLSKDLAAL